MAYRHDENLQLRQETLKDADLLRRWDGEPHARAATSDGGESGFDAASDCFVCRLDRAVWRRQG